MANVEVLLATYNGEKYLSELLDSLLQQRYRDFKILVRDDGSTDSTYPILISYQERYPEKISVFSNDSGLSGPIENFSLLLSISTAPYVMFCDQDDVWLPDKIERSLKEIERIEEINGASTPILVHTDLLVVDQDLEPIAESFWKYSGLNSGRDDFSNLLVQNVVTGCTMIMNRNLVAKCGRIPQKALMHDWWLALVASASGVIGKINSPTILYRQHGQNRLGAKEFHWNVLELIDRLMKYFKSRTDFEYFVDNYVQANQFIERYSGKMPVEIVKKAEAFVNLRNQGFLEKRVSLLTNGFLFGNFIQNLSLLIRI